ncbi:hypothetical protein M422DRAFT_247757 [Sphaerobolus stellatus SS14]|nr:hypothetical protein M422DRAFT_247757 [Sphaerobolus stellatus SS14]
MDPKLITATAKMVPAVFWRKETDMIAGIQQLVYIFDSSFEGHGKLITGSTGRAHACYVAILHFYCAILHGYNPPRDSSIATWLKHRNHNFRKVSSSREVAGLIFETMVKKNDTPDWLNFSESRGLDYEMG